MYYIHSFMQRITKNLHNRVKSMPKQSRLYIRDHSKKIAKVGHKTKYESSEILILSLYHVILKPTRIMNRVNRERRYKKR